MIYLKNPKHTDRPNGFPFVFCFFPGCLCLQPPTGVLFSEGWSIWLWSFDLQVIFFPIEVGGIAFEYNLMMIQQWIIWWLKRLVHAESCIRLCWIIPKSCMLIFVVNCSLDTVFFPCFWGLTFLWVFARWLRRFRCFVRFRIRSGPDSATLDAPGWPKKERVPFTGRVVKGGWVRGETVPQSFRLESLRVPQLHHYPHESTPLLKNPTIHKQFI